MARLKLNPIVAMAVSAATVLAIRILGGILPTSRPNSGARVAVPFVFSSTLNPRQVLTVGDQMLVEHLFPFHQTALISRGKKSLFSRVTVDESSQTVFFEPTKYLSEAGLSLEQYERAIRYSFQGTLHHVTAGNDVRISRQDSKVAVHLNNIPVNLDHLLAIPDFAIYSERDGMDMDQAIGRTFGGPYDLESRDSETIHLVANPKYPSELRTNAIQKATLESYTTEQLPGVLERLKTGDLDFGYVYGFAADRQTLDSLEDKNRVSEYPSQWILMFGFQNSISSSTRSTFARIVHKFRSQTDFSVWNGTTAFSLQPSDHPSGMTAKQYEETVNFERSIEKLNGVRIGTIADWSNLSILKGLITELQGLGVKFLEVPRDQVGRIYSSEFDGYLSPLGISKADPITHMNLLGAGKELAAEILTQNRLQEVAHSKTGEELEQKVDSLERQLAKSFSVLPISHFSGVLVESRRFRSDPKLRDDWGIQLWTYKSSLRA